MKFESKKRAQKEIIERIAKPEIWLKEAIINVLDEQISHLPELDQQRYIIYLRSAEHPDGYKIGLEVRPVLRLKGDEASLMIVRDSGDNPDSYFWDEATYDKMKKKGLCYFIGTQNGHYLECYYGLRSRLAPYDGRQLANKVAASRNPLEVIETPAEERRCIYVTSELAAALDYRLLESYNDWDENEMSPLNEGDLLVLDGEYYYRVDAKLAQDTYRKI